MVTISVWGMGCFMPFFFMVNIHEQILAAIYENTSVTMTCNIFQCAVAPKPISFRTVRRNMFMRTSQTHHYEFDCQTANIGTNRFELKICDFLGTNKQTTTKNKNEQLLKYKENKKNYNRSRINANNRREGRDTIYNIIYAKHCTK